ncbi:hypothetical protein C8P68_104352 [Mucilaginibacter yixingensis]|uniref:Uncharacterized protein n=1 Tax=Mucilaginibacter yixingensis TaxID=1295612 RepID=A0A2T5J9V3_9SPHI|nr:hypothetical protein [Mucilaginibacter yixingensis]PTQ96860.1 hypothetical protein C8P68_104352 [Mucilaginibacter yixingensis]
MRVIAELPHPDFKITIMSMNQKFIIKTEKGVYEQIYKVADMDLLKGIDSVFELLDEEFLNKINERFKEMNRDFKANYEKYNL